MRKLPVMAAFRHIWNSTTHNIRFAWHVSWPWMLLMLPVNIAGNVYALSNTAAPEELNLNQAFVGLLIGLLTMFAFASIAVNWHRYILRDEVPMGWARLRADNAVWRYFGNTLLIVCILIGCFIPLFLVAALLMSALGTLGAVVATILDAAAVLYGISAFYRLSVKLPAIALERRDYRFTDAWRDTHGNEWQLIGLGLLFALVVFALALVVASISVAVTKTQSDTLLFGIIGVQLVFNWAATIMAVTLLTSLYGFFVERRDF